MEDNRVGARFGELWSAASKELKWVIDLPRHVFVKIAEGTGGCSPADLQDRVIAAAQVSYHFIWRRVLQPASLYPWRLCRGDIDANLDELAELDSAPDEPCTQHIYELLQEDHPRPQLVEAVQLLGQCPWSSMPAEQQHASVALLHRNHQEYEMPQLICRALLHQAVRLLPHQSKIDKQLARVMKKMAKVQRAVPQRAGGSHMLVKALVAVVRTRQEWVVGGAVFAIV